MIQNESKKTQIITFRKAYTKFYDTIAENLKDINYEKGFIEPIFRLFLNILGALSLGVLIRITFSTKYRSLFTDFYVLIKPLLLYYILRNNLYNSGCIGDVSFFVYVSFYFVIETIVYNLSTIFNSENFFKPKSYKRKIILLFINYVEINFGFAVIYLANTLLNTSCKNYSDAIYFSFITSATVGFGDIYPISAFGKQLASIQTINFIIFTVILLSFFASKIVNKHYKTTKKHYKTTKNKI
jgi:hypothetical protein